MGYVLGVLEECSSEVAGIYLYGNQKGQRFILRGSLVSTMTEQDKDIMLKSHQKGDIVIAVTSRQNSEGKKQKGCRSCVKVYKPWDDMECLVKAIFNLIAVFKESKEEAIEIAQRYISLHGIRIPQAKCAEFISSIRRCQFSGRADEIVNCFRKLFSLDDIVYKHAIEGAICSSLICGDYVEAFWFFSCKNGVELSLEKTLIDKAIETCEAKEGYRDLLWIKLMRSGGKIEDKNQVDDIYRRFISTEGVFFNNLCYVHRLTGFSPPEDVLAIICKEKFLSFDLNLEKLHELLGHNLSADELLQRVLLLQAPKIQWNLFKQFRDTYGRDPQEKEIHEVYKVLAEKRYISELMRAIRITSMLGGSLVLDVLLDECAKRAKEDWFDVFKFCSDEALVAFIGKVKVPYKKQISSYLDGILAIKHAASFVKILELADPLDPWIWKKIRSFLLIREDVRVEILRRFASAPVEKVWEKYFFAKIILDYKDCFKEVFPKEVLKFKGAKVKKIGGSPSIFIEEGRHRFWVSKKPSEVFDIFFGNNHYLVFVFDKVVILDSVIRGNAAYVFSRDVDFWNLLSMSKRKLDSLLPVGYNGRFTHTQSWKLSANRALKGHSLLRLPR